MGKSWPDLIRPSCSKIGDARVKPAHDASRVLLKKMAARHSLAAAPLPWPNSRREEYRGSATGANYKVAMIRQSATMSLS